MGVSPDTAGLNDDHEVIMREFALKMSLFLFLASLLGARNELGILTGAVTGTILLWPLYRKWINLSVGRPPHRDGIERRDPNFVPGGRRLEGDRCPVIPCTASPASVAANFTGRQETFRCPDCGLLLAMEWGREAVVSRRRHARRREDKFPCDRAR